MPNMKKNLKKNYIDEENRVVVSKFDDYSSFGTMINDDYYSFDDVDVLSAVLCVLRGKEKHIMDRSDFLKLSAKSKCCDSDSFNVKIGKEIADMKLDMKYHERRARDNKKICKYLTSLINKINDDSTMREKKIANIQSDLIRVYGYNPDKF